jgi:type I restriction enzyme S subunit
LTGWRRLRLKHLAAVPIVNGVGERGEYEEQEWPRYVRTTDIAGPRRLRVDTFKSLPPHVAEKAPLERGDLLMVAAGATIGKSYLHASDQPACFAGYLVRFRPRYDVDSRFVAYWTESAPYWQQIESQHIKATIENFSAARYRNLVIDVPSFNDQQRIADFLDREIGRIDAAISVGMRLLDLIRERWTAAVSRFTDSPQWPQMRLKRVLARTLEYGIGEPALFEEPSWPRYIRTTDVTVNGDLREETFKSLPPEVARRFLLTDGDLLFTRSGATVGKTFLYRQEWGPACFAGYLIRATANRSKALPEFLNYFAQSQSYWAQIDLLTLQATIQNVSAERYGDLLVRLPTVQEQERIIAHLRNLELRVADLRRLLTNQTAMLRERRQSLMAAAVAGLVDV